MTLIGQNYIGGSWINSNSRRTLERINPANKNEVVGVIQDSDEDDLSNAVKVAKQAFADWRKLSSVQRGKYLEKAASILENQADTIAKMATKEMGKILPETKGEVLRGAAILRYFSQEGMRQVGEILPSVNSKNFLFTKRVPLGVVGIIAPWNFPIAIPLWKIAPALIYGNTVVFKPAVETGLTAVKIVKAFEEAGLPEGVLNLIHGKGSIIGEGISTHPDVNAISFTGSNEVGKKIAGKALSRGAKYQLEMGGKNPAIVLEDANLDLAVDLIVDGAMKQTGQRCTATSRVIVQHSVYNEFKKRLIRKIKSLKIGSGFDDGVNLGPLVSKNQQEKVLGYIQEGINEGASLLTGGGIPEGKLFEHGFYVEPTVFENVTNDMVIAQEEIFGPVLCLIEVDGFEDAVKQANDTRFGLSASLFTNDLAKPFEFIDLIETGLIQINGETGGAEPQAPFGGMKESSSHSREQGQAAKEFFTSLKTVTIHPLY